MEVVYLGSFRWSAEVSPISPLFRYGDDSNSGVYTKPTLKLPSTGPAQPTPILLSPRDAEGDKAEAEKKHEESWYDEVIDWPEAQKKVSRHLEVQRIKKHNVQGTAEMT